MKKIIFASIALVVVVLAVLLVPSTRANSDFLRIHIRADSNLDTDQSVKYAVKAAVVDYLTPYLTQATTKQKAMEIVNAHAEQIKDVCDRTLQANGKSYTATVRLATESFPDRSYNGTTLPAGVYDALIIERGSGSGNNWWCVVYPPLCFVGGEGSGSGNIAYRSKLWEIIQNWQNSH